MDNIHVSGRRESEARLERRGVKPTANRVLVMEAILSAQRAVSLADIEAILGTVDRSSVFRTLGLFVKHHVVHAIDDGSGSVKYEACDSHDDCSVADMHTHFYCEVCHRTFCLKTIGVPVVDLPAGFVTHSINYIVKGICDKSIITYHTYRFTSGGGSACRQPDHLFSITVAAAVKVVAASAVCNSVAPILAYLYGVWTKETIK